MLIVSNGDTLNPHSKRTRDNGKRGTRWEIRVRKIRKRVRNRTLKNNIRRTKRRWTSNRKELLDARHGPVILPENKFMENKLVLFDGDNDS